MAMSREVDHQPLEYGLAACYFPEAGSIRLIIAVGMDMRKLNARGPLFRWLANHTGVSLLLTIERSLNRSCD